jgi:hypothetical protein
LRISRALRAIYAPLLLATVIVMLARVDIGLYVATITVLIMALVETFLGIFDTVKIALLSLGSFLAGATYLVTDSILIKFLVIVSLLVVIYAFVSISQ